MTRLEFQLYQEQTFDSYVKLLIRNEARNARKELARRAKREVSLSSLPYGDLPAVSNEGQEKFGVHINGGEVEVSDCLLGQAIMSLVPKWRDVIVMYYFLGMSDKKIGGAIHLTTGAVRYRRKMALERLKTMLEAIGYDE